MEIRARKKPGLIIKHRIRKRERRSERTIITDVYPDTSDYLGIYRLAVKGAL